MTTKPTALPERLEAKRVGGINAAHIYHNGDVIDGPMHPLFAAELVRRYNAHDELVRALEAIADKLEPHLEDSADDIGVKETFEMFDIAKTALARADRKEP